LEEEFILPIAQQRSFYFSNSRTAQSEAGAKKEADEKTGDVLLDVPGRHCSVSVNQP
jgi:hypothetical protein